MLATTKIVRNFARAINGGGFGYAGTYTDRGQRVSRKRDDGMRHVAFRLHNKEAADKLASELAALLFLTGYTNEVKRTTSKGDWMRRTQGGEYVRVKALLG